jgi:Carboxypeptidase regulatory-like domain
MTKSLARLISIGLLGTCAFAGDTDPKTGALQGTVFTTDADGGRSVVPGAKVSLNGPTPSETSPDAEGKFVFRALQPGSYILKSEACGMTATQVVVGSAGAVPAASLEMKVAVVEQSTTVTASSDAVGTQEPAGTNTVGEQAVKDMPTLNGCFEDLLSSYQAWFAGRMA